VIETRIISKPTLQLLEFINECDRMNYNNNNSLESMKFNNTLRIGGNWFATFHNTKIVGISGVHPFLNGIRALFRGCQLYSIPGGLSKNHMNCWMFRYHLPIVINMYSNKPIYITTNTETDHSGKMLKLNKLYHILAKKQIVEHLGCQKVFDTEQNIWKLNIKEYCKINPEI
jgi:hypothetical protein